MSKPSEKSLNAELTINIETYKLAINQRRINQQNFKINNRLHRERVEIALKEVQKLTDALEVLKIKEVLGVGDTVEITSPTKGLRGSKGTIVKRTKRQFEI